MISVDFVIEQIKRLAGVKNFPRSKELQLELLEALQQCEDEAQCKDLVGDWIRYEGRVPDAAGARQIIRTTRTKPAPECRLCQGMGWVPVEGKNGVARCVCLPQQEKTPRRESASKQSEFDDELRAFAEKKRIK